MIGSERLVVSPMTYVSKGRGIVLGGREVDNGVLDRRAVAFLAVTPPVVDGPLDRDGIVSYAVADGAVIDYTAEYCVRGIITLRDNASVCDGLHPV